MYDSQSHKSNTRASVVVSPTDGSLDHPAGRAQAAAMQCVAPGDLGLDALNMKGAAIFVVIVATVSLDDAGLGERAPVLATNRWNRLDEEQKLGHVITIGAGQYDGQENALRFGDQVVLGARACTVGGIGSCF